MKTRRLEFKIKREEEKKKMFLKKRFRFTKEKHTQKHWNTLSSLS